MRWRCRVSGDGAAPLTAAATECIGLTIMEIRGAAASTTVVEAGRHRIEVSVFGRGSPVVVIEPSFGGCAAEWRSIAESLAAQTTVVCDDRGADGAGTPADIAAHLPAVLQSLAPSAPLVLVGFSAGGLYVRKYAAMYPADVVGMVLVESSHEGQTPLLNAVFTWRVRLEGTLFYPQILLSTRAKREGADRLSMMREWRAFRGLTAADRPLAPGALGELPLAVLTRADGGPYGGRQWQGWHEFHSEHAALSANSHHLISRHAEHGLHESDPDLVIAALTDVVNSVRTGTSLRHQRQAG